MFTGINREFRYLNLNIILTYKHVYQMLQYKFCVK